MAQRQALAAQSAAITAAAHMRCQRERGMSDGTRRLVTVSYVMAELTEQARKVSSNLDDYGEITPQVYEEFRLTIRDMATNVFGARETNKKAAWP